MFHIASAECLHVIRLFVYLVYQRSVSYDIVLYYTYFIIGTILLVIMH